MDLLQERGRPALFNVTLEALAVHFSLKAFHHEEQEQHSHRVHVIPTWTDNYENGSALKGLMKPRLPASAVVMELSAFMKRRCMKVPKTGNLEAGALVNGDT